MRHRIIEMTRGDRGYAYEKEHLRFSQIELKHLFIAWAAISFAFANILGGFSAVSFLVAGLTVGIGFIFHELAHKFTAQRFGCVAEFRADYGMLGFAVLMSFMGFIFAAPGAVMIMGHINKKQNGLISLAGPVTNLVLAVLFLAVSLFVKETPILTMILGYGFMINAWLALFNMIPLGNFDGRKVLAWNKVAFGVTLAVALFMVFFMNVL